MVKFTSFPTDGEDDINISSSGGGLMGMHYTLWGRGVCIHLYEDECALNREQLTALGVALEESTKICLSRLKKKEVIQNGEGIIRPDTWVDKEEISRSNIS